MCDCMMSSFQRLKLKNADKLRGSFTKKTTKLGEIDRSIGSPIEEARRKKFSASIIDRRIVDMGQTLTEREIENSMFVGNMDRIMQGGTRGLMKTQNTTRSQNTVKRITNNTSSFAKQDTFYRSNESPMAITSKDLPLIKAQVPRESKPKQKNGPFLICHLKHMHELTCYTMSNNVRKSKSRPNSVMSYRSAAGRKTPPKQLIKKPEAKGPVVCGKDGSGTQPMPKYNSPEIAKFEPLARKPVIYGKDGAGTLPMPEYKQPELAVCEVPETKAPTGPRGSPEVARAVCDSRPHEPPAKEPPTRLSTLLG